MIKFRERIIDFSLLILAIFFAIYARNIDVDYITYIKAFVIYWFFSTLYYHFSLTTRKGNIKIDYGISYSTSFAIFTGPLGAFLFEFVLRFTIYIYKKITNKADSEEFLDTLYNIGSFTVCGVLAYSLYHWLISFFMNFPFGYWILLLIIVAVVFITSSMFLLLISIIDGQVHSWKDVPKYLVSGRSSLDIWKITISNGLLLIFLQMKFWDLVIVLFIMNYILSRSIYSKSQSIQHKNERDYFEQLAYTDFLTAIPNRAAMGKMMEILATKTEPIAIIVTDIDYFKKINDSYNHAVGDRVIQSFANILQTKLGDSENVFRSGGEEFTIILQGLDYRTCVDKIEQVKHYVTDNHVTSYYQDNIVHIHFTASFGLYYFIPAQLSIEKGYIEADTLLIEAKNKGRNSLCYDRHQA